MEYLPTLPSLPKARNREMCPQKELFQTQTLLSYFSFKRPRSAHMFTEPNVKGTLRNQRQSLVLGTKGLFLIKISYGTNQKTQHDTKAHSNYKMT